MNSKHWRFQGNIFHTRAGTSSDSTRICTTRTRKWRWRWRRCIPNLLERWLLPQQRHQCEQIVGGDDGCLVFQRPYNGAAGGRRAAETREHLLARTDTRHPVRRLRSQSHAGKLIDAKSLVRPPNQWHLEKERRKETIKITVINENQSINQLSAKQTIKK